MAWTKWQARMMLRRDRVGRGCAADPPLWYPGVGLITQSFHVALGLICVAVAVVFNWSPWWGAAAGVLIPAVKESTFDKWVEKDPWPNGLIDFAFWCVGVFCGLGLCHLAGK